MSNLWVQAVDSPAGEEPEYYTHVSPYYMRPGTILQPGKRWPNFPDNDPSGRHNYVTSDPDTAMEISHHLWEQGFPKVHEYDVQAHGELEPDERMAGSYKTTGPVEILNRTHVVRRRPVYRSPEGEETYGKY
jgi:hypothetical protein